MTVSATLRGTANTGSVAIKNAILTTAERNSAIELAKEMKALDEFTRMKLDARNALEEYVYKIKHRFENQLTGNGRAIIQKCSELLIWLKNERVEAKETYEAEQKELELMCKM